MAQIRASRLFTDREEPRAAFWMNYDKLKKEMPCSSRVLTYYGIGGIGKTSLLEKMAAEMDSDRDGKSDRVRYVQFDFESSQESNTVLERLKNLLQDRYKFSFPLFEIGSYLYYKKSGEDPEAPEEKQIADKNSGLKLAMEIGGEIPVVSGVIRMLSLLDHGAAMLRTYRKNHPQELKELQGLSARELRECLPKLFARDMTRNLEDAKVPLVILLDTYEKMVDELDTEGMSLNKDLWLRDGEGVIRNVPNTLWVIAGREKLKWEQLDPYWKGALEQHLLGELSPADGEGFLKAAGVAEPDLVRQLYTLTKGTPLYLDICAEQYRQLIAKGETPEISMFGTNVEKLVERFVRYMDKDQKQIVYLLSFLKSWDDPLVKNAAQEILGYFSRQDYKRIKELSFVIKADENIYHLHRTVEQILRKDRDNDLRQETADFIIRYHEALLRELSPASEGYQDALAHMIHGGLLLYSELEQLREFYEKQLREPIEKLIRYGYYAQADAVVQPLWQQAQRDKLSRLYAAMLSVKAHILKSMEMDMEQAEAFASQAVMLHIMLLGTEHPDTLQAMETLAAVHFSDECYEYTLELLEYILKKNTDRLGENHTDTLKIMAKRIQALTALERCEEACPMQEQLLEKYKTLYSENDPERLRAVFRMAYIYHALERIPQAQALYEELVERCCRNLGEKHPLTASSMNNLSAIYMAQEKYDQALPLREKIFKSREELLGEDHPRTVAAMRRLSTTLEKLGREEESNALWDEAWVREDRFTEKKPKRPINRWKRGINTTDALWEYGGMLQEQAELLRRRKQMLGGDHPTVVAAADAMARTLAKAGQTAIAAEVWDRLLTQMRRQNHPDTVAVWTRQLEVMDAGYFHWPDTIYAQVPARREELLTYYRESANEPLALIQVLKEQIRSYRGLKWHQKIPPLQEELLELLKIHEKDPQKVLDTQCELARAYSRVEQYEKALSLYQQVTAYYRMHDDEKHSKLRGILSGHADALDKLGRSEESIELLRELVDLDDQNGAITIGHLENLVKYCDKAGKTELANTIRERYWPQYWKRN